jgi:hypothetical protein
MLAGRDPATGDQTSASEVGEALSAGRSRSLDEIDEHPQQLLQDGIAYVPFFPLGGFTRL